MIAGTPFHLNIQVEKIPSPALSLSLSCVSGLFLFYCFPIHVSHSFLAWFALVPLLLALEGRSCAYSFVLSSLAGLLSSSGVFGLVGAGSSLPVVGYGLLALYLLLWGGVFGLIYAYLRQRTNIHPIVIGPALWVTIEYLRSHVGFLSTPWLLLGYSQYTQPELMQLASLTGVYGVSFLIVMVNVAIAGLFQGGVGSHEQRWSLSFSKQKFWVTGLTLSVLIGCIVFGVWRLSSPAHAGDFKIALIQGHIPQLQKWDGGALESIVQRYEQLTRQAVREDPDFIIWPETAIPGDVNHNPTLRDRLSRLAIQANAYLLVGAAESTKYQKKRKTSGLYYNTLHLFSPTGQLVQEHRKLLPVPFAEYDPSDGKFSWTKSFGENFGKVIPGEQLTVFQLPRSSFGSIICWEGLFPDLFLKFVRGGATFMVNATDEGWFGDPMASSQFLGMTAFRAAETGVPIVRAANFGISAVIDPFGQVRQQLVHLDGKRLFGEGILLTDIALGKTSLTFYAKFGDVFSLIQMAFCFCLLLSCSLHSAIPWLGRKSVFRPKPWLTY